MEPSQVPNINQYRAALMRTEPLIWKLFEYTTVESLNQKGLKMCKLL